MAKNRFYGVPNELGVVPVSPRQMYQEAARIAREQEEAEYPSPRYEYKVYDPDEERLKRRHEDEMDRISVSRGVSRWG